MHRNWNGIVHIEFHFFNGVIISIIFPTCFFDIGPKASGCLLQLGRFRFLGRRFLSQTVIKTDTGNPFWGFQVFFFLVKMVWRNESPTSARERVEYIPSCLHYLLLLWFGEFRVGWLLIIHKIHHMGFNISKIWISCHYCKILWHNMCDLAYVTTSCSPFALNAWPCARSNKFAPLATWRR